MNIAAVMDEIATALHAITGLRVFPYNADRVTAPAVVVTLPDEVEYDTTMVRGGDTFTLDLYLFVARIDQRTGRDALAAYLNGSGSKSIKAAVDSSATVVYTSADVVRVTKASVEPLSSAGVDHLGAVFTLEITGKGA